MRFAIIVLLFSTTARRSISTSSEIENPQEPIVKRNLRRLSPFCVSSTCLAGGESEGVTCFPECCCSKKCRTTYDPYLFLSTGVCEYGPAPTTNVAPVTPPPPPLLQSPLRQSPLLLLQRLYRRPTWQTLNRSSPRPPPRLLPPKTLWSSTRDPRKEPRSSKDRNHKKGRKNNQKQGKWSKNHDMKCLDDFHRPIIVVMALFRHHMFHSWLLSLYALFGGMYSPVPFNNVKNTYQLLIPTGRIDIVFFLHGHLCIQSNRRMGKWTFLNVAKL